MSKSCPVFMTSWTDCMWHAGSSTISWRVKYLLVDISIESVMLSNRLILCYPLLLLPSIFPSIRVFCSELALPIRWPKYWSFSFSISPSSEYSGWFSWMFFLNKGRQVWSPWSPRDSQESSPAPQVESINSLTLSLFYGPTLTYILDDWKRKT